MCLSPSTKHAAQLFSGLPDGQVNPMTPWKSPRSSSRTASSLSSPHMDVGGTAPSASRVYRTFLSTSSTDRMPICGNGSHLCISSGAGCPAYSKGHPPA